MWGNDPDREPRGPKKNECAIYINLHRPFTTKSRASIVLRRIYINYRVPAPTTVPKWNWYYPLRRVLQPTAKVGTIPAMMGLLGMRVGTKIAGVALLAVAAAQLTAVAQDRNREADAADVREAVVRYQVKTWYLSVDSYCVSVNRRSARKEFLERFADSPKVKSSSACFEPRRGFGRMRMPSWVSDKQTGQPAVMFDAGAVRWVGDDAAEVKGSYYCAFRCWASGVYHVVRGETGWTVLDFTIERQSEANGDF